MRYKTNHLKLNKMLLLIAVLAMSLLLCGCRTRISNNTEVASTITDDEGWMQELYQERRDELGIPVAKKPFFTGSPDEDIEGYDGYDDYDSDMDSLDEYAADPWEDEDYDDVDGNEQTSSSSSTSSSSTTTPSRRTGTTTVRRRTTTTTPRRRTSTTTTTKKKPTNNTSNNSNNNTETPKKKYTVSFDGDGVDMDGITITVEEGGTYGNLPNPPGRDGYTFVGWFTEKDGKGTEIKKGDSITGNSDHTLYAYWTKEPFKAWQDEFDIAANEIRDNKENCYVISGDDKAKGFVEECKGVSVGADQSPTCLIVFAKNDDPASDAYTKYHDGAEGIEPISSLEKAIVVSADSIGDDNKANLIYKILLLSELYGSFSADDINKAVTDLGIDSYYIDIYPTPNP